jgi:proline racemase
MKWKRTFTVVGCHCEGEVGNVVTGGVPNFPGRTVFEKMQYMEQNYDHFRKLVLFEPRGMAVNNTNVIVPPCHPEAQMGYIILESTEYPPMSGSNTICVATVLLETGILEMQEPVTRLTLEAPAGLIKVDCECKDGHVERVTFTNQPAFVYHLDEPLHVPGVGDLKVDVAYGGMTFVMIEAESLGLRLEPNEARHLCELGERIKACAAEKFPAVHPTNPDIHSITNLQFVGPLIKQGDAIRSRNATVVRPGRLDRSPCGTGTSARLAILHAKKRIEVGQTFIHESVIGSQFVARVAERTTIGPYDAIIPEVSGRAWLTHISQHGLDPRDPFQEGYTVSDTWLKTVS